MIEENGRIFHIITGLNEGGAEAVLYRLCVADKTHRHCVVSLMDAGKYGPLLEREGVPVVCLCMPRGRVTFRGLWRLWRLLRSEKPEIVQTWMYHGDLIGGVIARMAGLRRVFWGVRHSTLERGKSRRSTIMIARLNAWLSHWVPEAIICCAERAREVHRLLGYASHKLVVIPNGYDLRRFQPDETARVRLRDEWDVADDVPLVGMVGRLDPQKDHENLLNGLSRLKQQGVDFRCVLVGRGLETDNEPLLARIRAAGLVDRIVLAGPRSDMPAVMRALDLHVLSSSAEAFPNVLAEAMACGTPCVTTNVGDAAFIVGDTGWVVPPRDGVQLAEALQAALAALENTDGWRMRCDAARARIAEHFGLESMVKAYAAVWRGAVVEN